ncbi:TPM domain-containing protein [Tenacibaculum larymnensis]|uniref:TPM domain-containing protein n=1 Tax=Tenacibaculum larymnensis TaxID=2878201 RepID=A0A9X4IRP4_9FLAO|nr:TPM domain-containing protein [Tenacibaculum larymnensis]MDE1208167.1 TPM domain-containing protein [Tenacibaculum larymnensis]
MKLFFKIIILSFLTISSCKLQQNEKDEINTNAPKAEFTEFDLGESDLPTLKNVVNDYESLFTIEQLEKLTLLIREYEKKTSNQIAIVSIKSIGKYTDFSQFAIDLSNYNGVGQKEKNNGLTIVFSKTLRKIRISTGVGTEQILTDEICEEVIEKTIIPEFKKGEYYLGIEKGITELMTKWE